MRVLLFILSSLFFSSATAQDTLTVRIKGMKCEECGHKVMVAVKQLPGIESMRFNYERRTSTIVYDPAQTCADSIRARLAATGRFKASAYSPTEVIRRGFGLRMDDMHCQNCANRIAAKLQQMEGIDSMSPHLDKHYFFIRYDANRTCKDEIRALLNELGYTPCNYYTSPKIGWFYLILPAEQATEETMETVLALDGVEDVNVNPKRKSMAITYFNDEVKGERLLELIHQAGIKAEVPKPHVCEEEKKE